VILVAQVARMNTDTLWFESTIIMSIFAVGNILFGHFEEGTSKWRRVRKCFTGTAIFVLLSYYAGRPAFWAALGITFIFAIVVHAWWLPKNGINGWTGEPRDKYYALRGWKLKSDK